jgi:hypothetical protein
MVEALDRVAQELESFERPAGACGHDGDVLEPVEFVVDVESQVSDSVRTLDGEFFPIRCWDPNQSWPLTMDIRAGLCAAVEDDLGLLTLDGQTCTA